MPTDKEPLLFRHGWVICESLKLAMCIDDINLFQMIGEKLCIVVNGETVFIVTDAEAAYKQLVGALDKELNMRTYD